MGDFSKLPPGFHFYPTDEELIVHFLQRKASLLPFHPDLIPDLHHYPYNPWELHGKAMEEGNKWYFYSRRMSSNRSTETGYWKSMGAEEPVFTDNNIIGMKKYYVFCLGNANSSNEDVKTNWIMQEFRLSDHHQTVNNASSSKRRSSSHSKSKSKQDHSKLVLCRVYEHCDDDDNDNGMELSCMDEVFLSLDDLDEISYPN
ncbi:NAC domain-containing protein 104-like [Impatiens glandulifera]|uniref:NAC domain-containing protein 104-like n=1 Tax=Impatiens glandulifera TaxID=253017 RepID=UPI001FB0E64A|nr:NAC domain-containing protein 104-like [Impatiens glandulifera]